MNIFQSLALVGLIFSIAVNIVLVAIKKHVDHYWAVYPFWISVLILGYAIHKIRKDKGDEHHHH